MEGSVKSLIESEEEARKIVQQAEKEKNDKVKDARTMADQILNKKRADLEAEFRAEEEAVSESLMLACRNHKKEQLFRC